MKILAIIFAVSSFLIPICYSQTFEGEYPHDAKALKKHSKPYLDILVKDSMLLVTYNKKTLPIYKIGELNKYLGDNEKKFTRNGISVYGSGFPQNSTFFDSVVNICRSHNFHCLVTTWVNYQSP